MKKALITGITGFAGSHLAEYLLLQNKYTISGIHSSNRNIDNISKIKDKIELFQANLNDRQNTTEIIKKIHPDIIFHLAASADVGKSFDNPLEVLVNNSTSEFNVLDAVKNLEGETKIIIISSAQVYGYVASQDLPIDEHVSFKPDNPYAVSKITQEYLALQYFYTYKLPIIILRPFNHFGSRLSTAFALSRFAKTIAEIEKGQQEPMLTVGNLTAKRDFTDIEDMVRAYVLAAEHCLPGEVYNVGTGTSYTMQELLDKLLLLAKTEVTVKLDESLMRPSDNPELRADASKFMQATGWKPEKTIEKTLENILDYWRELV